MANSIIASLVLCAFNFLATVFLFRISRNKPWNGFIRAYGIGTGIKLCCLFTAFAVLIFAYDYPPGTFLPIFAIIYFISLMLEIFYINYQKKSINLYDIEKTKQDN